jgi:hypothetical protein
MVRNLYSDGGDPYLWEKTFLITFAVAAVLFAVAWFTK